MTNVYDLGNVCIVHGVAVCSLCYEILIQTRFRIHVHFGGRVYNMLL